MMKTLALLFWMSLPSFAAISSASVWELRTTGSDSNGGFFVAGASGTDYSQQDAAQYTFTDLASTNATTNPCIVSSASHNFVAADVGNGLQITNGTNWNAGWYQIVSVSSNNATLDRACGGVASITGGTYAVGGALATWATAIGTAGTAIAGNTVWVKSGTFTLTAAVTLQNSGTETAGPIIVHGYHTTRGDQDGTQPLLTTATNSTSLINPNAKLRWQFINLHMTNTAGTRASGFNCTAGGAPGYMAFTNLVMDGFSTAFLCGNIGAANGINNSVLQNSEVKNCTGNGIEFGGTAVFIMNNYIHGNTGSGIDTGASLGSANIIGNFVASNSSRGIKHDNDTATNMILINNTVYSNTSDGIYSPLTSASSLEFILMNNVIYGNGGFGVNITNSTTAGILINQNNAYGSNTSGARSGIAAGANDVTLTADPLTSSTNAALNNTAGGGAACRAAGFAGVMTAGGTGYIDIGALQHQDAGSGGQRSYACVQ
jgi:parallel beta helix pectate lyase-like protein